MTRTTRRGWFRRVGALMAGACLSHPRGLRIGQTLRFSRTLDWSTPASTFDELNAVTMANMRITDNYFRTTPLLQYLKSREPRWTGLSHEGAPVVADPYTPREGA